ncbi:hypothetical protein [Thermomonospora cellulosilytica]|uniref:Uncharacterized protein n=1 Tax=Thermomonospora cellulosilytica TaxID=1411118 RepID=A0A7W3MTL3_9ACTN|nr:hypothetical protein [Thermomonospora cellulosilytica]MBA9001658.1 hypothetical protein [Thermomonospora cellulosilytica]
MSRTLAPPPAWPVPVPRLEEERRRFAEIRVRYPDAVPWYGPKSGLWFAAPPGAPGLLHAPTLDGLVCRLVQHEQALAASRSRRAIAPSTAGRVSQATRQNTASGAGGDGGRVRSLASRTAMHSAPPSAPWVVPDVPPPGRNGVPGAFWRGLRRRLGLAVEAA